MTTEWSTGSATTGCIWSQRRRGAGSVLAAATTARFGRQQLRGRRREGKEREEMMETEGEQRVDLVNSTGGNGRRGDGSGEQQEWRCEADRDSDGTSRVCSMNSEQQQQRLSGGCGRDGLNFDRQPRLVSRRR